AAISSGSWAPRRDAYALIRPRWLNTLANRASMADLSLVSRPMPVTVESARIRYTEGSPLSVGSGALLTREEHRGIRRISSDAPLGLHRLRGHRRDRGLPAQLLRQSREPVPGASAVVATALWPLILLGANLHLSLANL